MRWRGLLAWVLVLLVSSPRGADADARIWTVRAGDALSLLAQRFGVTVDQIKEWNTLDSDMIRIGQSLIILDRSAAASEAPTPLVPEEKGVDWTPPFRYESERPLPQEQLPADAVASNSLATPPPALRSTVRRREAKPSGKGRASSTYTVRSGDTLSKVAVRFKTTVPALRRMNPGLKSNRIYVGDKIHVNEPPPKKRYIIEPGDTLSTIAHRYEVGSRQLLSWNRGLNRDRLAAGKAISIYTRVPISPSESIGKPHRGKLVDPVQLPRHAGYMVRTPKRAWGTEETVRWLQDGFDAVRRRYRYNKRVRVHDLSDRDGGRLRDHRSHQSGRDVDISLYQRDCKGRPCAYKKVKPSDLDVGRTWTLLAYWLKNGQIENVFLDYKLQKPIYNFAKKRGASKAQLERWFQYPRGKGSPYGTVRHFAKHDDHMHVRFVCPRNDRSCR